MDIERLPSSLLNGNFLHCRPVEGCPIVEAPIVQIEDGSTPTFKVAIVCLARRPCSKCELKTIAGSRDDNCQYWKGDSRGEYQIVGPNMDEKSEKG